MVAAWIGKGVVMPARAQRGDQAGGQTELGEVTLRGRRRRSRAGYRVRRCRRRTIRRRAALRPVGAGSLLRARPLLRALLPLGSVAALPGGPDAACGPGAARRRGGRPCRRDGRPCRQVGQPCRPSGPPPAAREADWSGRRRRGPCEADRPDGAGRDRGRPGRPPTSGPWPCRQPCATWRAWLFYSLLWLGRPGRTRGTPAEPQPYQGIPHSPPHSAALRRTRGSSNSRGVRVCAAE